MILPAGNPSGALSFPSWGETAAETYELPLGEVISIHPPRVGRDDLRQLPGGRYPISIHPPRVGRDTLHLEDAVLLEISIHPPRVGRDVLKIWNMAVTPME